MSDDVHHEGVRRPPPVDWGSSDPMVAAGFEAMHRRLVGSDAVDREQHEARRSYEVGEQRRRAAAMVQAYYEGQLVPWWDKKKEEVSRLQDELASAKTELAERTNKEAQQLDDQRAKYYSVRADCAYGAAKWALIAAGAGFVLALLFYPSKAKAAVS